MQPLARAAPERIAGLFFFDFVYPGIGPRMAEPERLNNIWYQSFHQMEMAPSADRRDARKLPHLYRHFLKHWSHRKDAFDDVIEAFTDNFLKAGNLAGGFAHYAARMPGVIRMLKGEAPQLPPIDRADLRSLGRARSAVSLRLDRSARRDLYRSRSGDVSKASDTSRIAKIPIARRARSRRSSNASAGADELKWDKGGTARRDKTPAAPCRFIEILAGKCGFAGQPERRNDRSGARETATRSHS